MRYSTEPKFRKYVKGYGFLSFARKFGDKYGKKLMDTATKTWIDAAKTAWKRIVQKTAEATGDLIRNKIADKITSVDKSKEKEKANKTEKIYISPEKRQQIIDDLRLFWIIIIIIIITMIIIITIIIIIVVIKKIILILLYKNEISEGYKFTWKNFW